MTTQSPLQLTPLPTQLPTAFQQPLPTQAMAPRVGGRRRPKRPADMTTVPYPSPAPAEIIDCGDDDDDDDVEAQSRYRDHVADMRRMEHRIARLTAVLTAREDEIASAKAEFNTAWRAKDAELHAVQTSYRQLQYRARMLEADNENMKDCLAVADDRVCEQQIRLIDLEEANAQLAMRVQAMAVDEMQTRESILHQYRTTHPEPSSSSAEEEPQVACPICCCEADEWLLLPCCGKVVCGSKCGQLERCPFCRSPDIDEGQIFEKWW